ncbi:MAG: hypothetical protein ACJ71W_23160 [Terriglobales bacterium]
MSTVKWFLSGFLLLASVAYSQTAATFTSAFKPELCPSSSGFCADLSRGASELVGRYTGHDEPAVLFYSASAGAGNNVTYLVKLPGDPPVAPAQNGTGGTSNFQLTPAFWFGMVLCDTQSSPNFTHVCHPDTDANIFDNRDPTSSQFIGHHPGAAFLELQFYPPGGLNTCSDPKLWCVSMAIFSFSVQDLTGKVNNADCVQKVGLEPFNAAFLTLNGIAQAAADPLNPDTVGKFAATANTFRMNSGDSLAVSIHDTANGVQAIVKDSTSGKTGSMTASIANGFAQVNFDPDPDPKHPTRTCSSTPFAFHPMYASSSEHTRATWTAHTYNISFSEEIGHFEYCNAVNKEGGSCIQHGVNDPLGLDADDKTGPCFSGAFLGSFGLRPIGACIGNDSDFDGPPYRLQWPGTGTPTVDLSRKPSTIQFSSPTFRPTGSPATTKKHFARVAFETNLPDNELVSNPACNVFAGGSGCTNPPHGAQFYPIFSIAKTATQCRWNFGGPHIPGTNNNFGGTSNAEYGAVLPVARISRITPQQPNGGSFLETDNFRRILATNPCP